MENATKALLIAAGTLFGVMLLALAVYFFRTLSPFEYQRQNTEEAEQITAFNTEYEAFNKRIMYGVDLISVLNKAKSNNEKYVSGNFLTGFTYNTDYLINIEFTINTELTDSVVVSYLSSRKTSTEDGMTELSGSQEYDYVNGKGCTDIKLLDVFNEPANNYFNRVNSRMNNSTRLITGYYTSNFSAGTYRLLETDGDTEVNEDVETLLNVADAIKQYVKNPSKDINDKLYIQGEAGGDRTGWSSAEWRTALYDLKTRKFRCTDVKYNEDTGRIIFMKFEEI